MERRLAAILAADVVGYCRLMRADEEATLAALKALRKEIIDPSITAHGGQIVKTMGDGLLIEFPSVVEAVRNAIELQNALRDHNSGVPKNCRVEFRIGINVGDIIVEENDILGDEVNIAARLEKLAEPGGVCLSNDAYNQVRDKLDFSFEYFGERELKNIDRPVRVWRWPSVPALDAVAQFTENAAPAGTEKISIAVLPFDNMSGDPEQEYFSDGITEDLITDLSKISELFVVARNATFTYKGKAVMPQQIAEDLGVRHILEGSVRKAGIRLRITAQLIDASSGGHIWAERYDRELTDIFQLQDEITDRIISALEVKLAKPVDRKASNRYTENLVAYDYFLRGRAYQATATNEGNTRAREMFEKAIELDPNFACAYAQLSYSHFREWRYQWSPGADALDLAYKTGKKAVELDDTSPLAHTYLGWAHLWRREHKQAIAEVERAIALDPNFAEGYARLGEILNLAGRPEEGVKLLEAAMRLDPHYPPTYLFFLGYGYYAMGRYDDAIAALKRSLARNPDHFSPHRTLAVIFSELGRIDEARAEVIEMLRISPNATLSGQKKRMPFRDELVLEKYMNGLRKAGLPE